MTTAQTGTSLRVSRVIRADPETVFRAWTEPGQLSRWSAPEGVDVDCAEVDLVVGGRYRIRMKNPEGQEFNAVGVYQRIDRPHLLSYTWQWEEQEHNVGETLVTVQFYDRGGATEVVLVHERFPTAEDMAKHEQGWSSCVNRLEVMFA